MLFAVKTAIHATNVIAEPFSVFYPSGKAGIMKLGKSQIN